MIVYVKTGCPWCAGVLELLNEQGIDFEERNVSENPEYMKEMQDKSGQTKAPTVDLDGEIFPDLGRDEVEVIFKERFGGVQ